MLSRYARGAVEVRSLCGDSTVAVRSRYACGAVEVLSWCGRGSVMVWSRFGHGAVEVRTGCGRGSVIVRLRYARGVVEVCFRYAHWCSSGSVRYFNFLSGGTVYIDCEGTVLNPLRSLLH